MVTVLQEGKEFPRKNPSTSEKEPAAIPLIATIANGSFADTLRVRLLSSPQEKQAPITARAPIEKPHSLVKFRDSVIPASVIKAIAHQTRLPIASLKTQLAIKTVATLSKFNRRDVVAAGVVLRRS